MKAENSPADRGHIQFNNLKQDDLHYVILSYPPGDSVLLDREPRFIEM